MMGSVTFLSFLLFSMCHSIHVAVNTWLNCSFFTLIGDMVDWKFCQNRLPLSPMETVTGEYKFTMYKNMSDGVGAINSFHIIGTRSWLYRSRDVIGHVCIRFAICHFLLVVNWYWASICHRFQDICIFLYLGHDLDLLGSRDVIGHVTIRFPSSHFL